MSLINVAYNRQYTFRQWLVGCWYARMRPPSVPALAREWAPTRVLLILAGLIGDSVMCTPLVTSLRHAWPNAHLTLLGRAHNCELLEGCPYIDAFHVVSVDPYTLCHRRRVRELRQWIVAQSFDLALIALGDQFASLIADAGVPVRVGDGDHFLEACFTHRYHIGSARTWGPDERLNALRCLGVTPDESSPHLWVSESARIEGRALLSSLGMKTDAAYAVIHPFGSTQRQWWPSERVRKLARAIVETRGVDVVVVGGPETKGRVSLDTAGVFDATGALTVSQLVAVLADASFVISTDSGPFHIAGALGTPLIGLFRFSRPEHAHRYPSASVLFGRDEHCDANCRWDRCEAVPCRQLSRLTVEDVILAASRIHQAA